MCLHIHWQYFENMKMGGGGCQRLNMYVLAVLDYTGTRISNIVIEYLRINGKYLILFFFYIGKKIS